MRRRARGQTIVLAAVGMVAIVGGLAMVIDAGMFFVIQRQLQTAADAAALAGAWHPPICLAIDCMPGQAMPPPALPVAPSTERISTCDGTPGYPACDVAAANAQTVAGLCGGSVPPATIKTGTTLNRPAAVNVIVVTVQCDAPYTFGRILGLSAPRHISASGAAAIGNRDANGDMTDFTSTVSGCSPDHCRIARLVE